MKIEKRGYNLTFQFPIVNFTFFELAPEDYLSFISQKKPLFFQFHYFCGIMRVIADIPHPRYKIQIFLYNAKYLVKIELGQFEQIFKIAESDVNGLEELKRMITDQLLRNSLERFLSMRTDWEEAFKNKEV